MMRQNIKGMSSGVQVNTIKQSLQLTTVPGIIASFWYEKEDCASAIKQQAPLE